MTDHIRAFLEENIESYEQLAVLLFLQRRASEWCTMDVIHAVGLGSQEVALDSIAHLLDRGLIRAARRGGAWCFGLAATGPQLAMTLDALVCSYAQQPHEVLRLVTTKAMKRLRAASSRSFEQVFAGRSLAR